MTIHAHDPIVWVAREGTCLHCGEPLDDADGEVHRLAGMHPDCALRCCIGSIGHQTSRCPCFGGTYDDPPGLTARQAATAAADLWRANRERPRRN